MKVTQEKLPASQLGLEIEIPPEMSKQAYEKTVREYSRSINIPGFRKGKVPRQVLIQRLGVNRIKMAVLEDVIEQALQKAVDQEKIEALGNFQLRSAFEDLAAQFEPGNALTFSAAVDVPPDVSVKDYQALHVKAEEVQYDPAKVDEVLEDYRNRVATLVPVEERPAQMGDVVIVDFTGTYIPAEEEDPIEIPGGSAQDFQLELKEGQFIEGFIEGVVGMQAGETKEVKVTFPTDYPQEDVAGKPATFNVTVKEIKEKELPELDDDFAQEISEFETLQELRDNLENRFRSEAEEQTKKNKVSAILDELVQHLDVELPETMIRREVDFLVTQTAMRLESQGLEIRKMLTEELVGNMRDRSRPEAIARLRRTLALSEVAKRESIEVDEKELAAKIEEFMQNYQDQDVDPERVRQVLEDDLLEEKVLDWLETNGTVELVPEGTLQPEAAVEDAVEQVEESTESASIAADSDTTVDSSEVGSSSPSDDPIEVNAEDITEQAAAEGASPKEQDAEKPDTQAAGTDAPTQKKTTAKKKSTKSKTSKDSKKAAE